MDALRQDLRFALRRMRRNPGLTAVCAASIALGIAAFVVISALAWAFFLRPLPLAAPGGLYAVTGIQSSPAATYSDSLSLSYPDALDIQRQSRSFAASGTYAHLLHLILSDGPPENAETGMVSATLFPLLGVRPLLGRGFRAADDRPGAARVLLLGYDLWQRRYRGDPRVVGRTIPASGDAYRVIGVMPSGFRFPDDDTWVPLWSRSDPADPRNLREPLLVARLRPGVSLAAARAEAAAIGKRLAARYPEADGGQRLDIIPFRSSLIAPDLRRGVLFVLAAVMSVLLIACANVTNLLLASTAGRGQELSLRIACGAGRGRIVRQLLSENLLLALAGGCLGLPLGLAVLPFLRREIPPLPDWFVPRADAPVLAAALAATLAAGLLFGLAPAFHACRTDLRGSLRRGARRISLHSVLVIAEVALSTVLLVAAALSLRSLAALQQTDGGLQADRLCSVTVYLHGDRYADPARRARQVQAFVDRIAALPGVERAAGTNKTPLGFGTRHAERIAIAGNVMSERPAAFWTTVTGGFFATVRAPLAEGRDLTREEGSARSSAAVVNRTFAARFWPRGSALGHRLRILDAAVPGWLTVVGVAGDIKYGNLREPAVPTIYVSEAYHERRPVEIVTRSGRPAAETLAEIRRAVHAIDPTLALFQESSMNELRAEKLKPDRLFGSELTLFGAIALLFAATGIYGVLSQDVSRRWREIGIRLALGARREHVFRLLVGRGMALAAAGLALGLPAALAVARGLADRLYGVGPADPVSFAGMAILFLDVAFIACYLPARRAVDADPLEVLREE